jgi:hypothetical protein
VSRRSAWGSAIAASCLSRPGSGRSACGGRRFRATRARRTAVAGSQHDPKRRCNRRKAFLTVGSAFVHAVHATLGFRGARAFRERVLAVAPGLGCVDCSGSGSFGVHGAAGSCSVSPGAREAGRTYSNRHSGAGSEGRSGSFGIAGAARLCKGGLTLEPGPAATGGSRTFSRVSAAVARRADLPWAGWIKPVVTRFGLSRRRVKRGSPTTAGWAAHLTQDAPCQCSS